MAIPVTLDDAKWQLRLEADDASQDAEIESLIADAAAWVERYTGHILTARDVTEVFGGFGRLRLKAWPVKPGATVAVTYADASGTTSVAGARLLAGSRPAALEPAFGTRWPTLPSGAHVAVTVRAGYEDGDPVPGNLRRAMLVLIGAAYADREGGEAYQAAEQTARALCGSYRMRSL